MCLMFLFCCSFLPKECSSGLPSIAALVGDLRRLQYLRGVPAPSVGCFLDDCISRHAPNILSLRILLMLLSTCLLRYLFHVFPAGLHLSANTSPHFCPNGCPSHLFKFRVEVPHAPLVGVLAGCGLVSSVSKPQGAAMTGPGQFMASSHITPTASATETLSVLPSTPRFPKPCQFCQVYLLFVSDQQPAHLLRCTAGFCL